MVSSTYKKFIIALISILVIIFYGVSGYMFISDYSWIDALYMTIITITTVGFQEVNPTDETGKLFTISLIIFSMFMFAYSMSVIVKYILLITSIEKVKSKKMKKHIDNLNGHIIICGYGRNGRQATRRFLERNKDVVVIDKNPKTLENTIISYIVGDSRDEKTLIKAGIKKAKYLVVVFPDDADNLFTVLSARQLNKRLIILSRASRESSRSKLILAGANHTVIPDRIGGDHTASLLLYPDLANFLNAFHTDIEGNIREFKIGKNNKYFNGRTIADLKLRNLTGCTVIGYMPIEGGYIINPDPSTSLESGSKIVALGTHEQIRKLNKLITE